MGIEIVFEGVYSVASVDGEEEVDRLLAKALGGFGIEELILNDTQAQRRLGRALRNLQREQRKALIEEAANKIKEAANDRFWSALAGALVNVGVAASGFLQGPLEGELGQVGAKAIVDGIGALGNGFSKFNPLDVAAAEKDADAKLVQEEAQTRGDLANDACRWMAAAKELERKMLDRLENLSRSEHEGRMSVLNRIGG